MENKGHNKPNTKTSEFSEGNTKSYATSTPQTQRPDYNPPGQGTPNGNADNSSGSSQDNSSSSSQITQGDTKKD